MSRRIGLGAGLMLVLLASVACSSSGGSVSGATAKRVKAGFAAIAADSAYSVDFSIARRQGTGDEQVLACLSVDSDPRHPDGNHLTITNWGAGTVLDPEGGCEGGGDSGGEITVAGNDVYLADGPAPAGHVTCGNTYRRNRLSAGVLGQLKSFTRAQSPRVDRLLAAATSSSGDGTSSVTLHLDPTKAAQAAVSQSASARATPDSETMTITFASSTSSTIEAAEVDASSGDQDAIFRYEYVKLDPGQYTAIPKHCLARTTGTVTDLAQLKAALGF